MFVLDDSLKKTIQQHYSQLLETKQWKPRLAQRLMIAEIAKTIGAVKANSEGVRTSEPTTCVIEASTGTGKTLAYTMAAVPVAMALEKTVVISTATVALQEQVLYKDLPDIQRHSGLPFNFALAKGRQRYVCVSKLDRLLHDTGGDNEELFSALYPDEQWSYANNNEQSELAEEMLNAMASGVWDGDRENWQATLSDEQWSPMTVDRNQCTGRRCAFISQCSFFKARERVQQVDVIVANHDLVLSDLALGGGAILSEPENTIYIFDEAHHLGQKALQHFSSQFRLQSTFTWLEQIQQLCAFLQEHIQLPISDHSERQLQVLPSEIAIALRELELPLEQYLQQAEEDAYSGSLRYRFNLGVVPDSLREMSQSLAQQYTQLHALLESLREALEDVSSDKQQELRMEWDACWNLVAQHTSRAIHHCELFQAYAKQDGHIPWARWIEKKSFSDSDEIFIHASPILAQDIMQTEIWQRSYASILSSATLSSLGDFERLKMQLGLPENSVFKQLPSAFDAQKVAFNVPALPCEPSNVAMHTQYMIESLPELLSKRQGSLVLFSSRRQMQEVYQGLDNDWQNKILTQDDFSKIEVIRRHRKAIDDGESSVIFGLASFSEGIDLPGVYCQHVIIAKLPFSVPGHPIEEVLADWLKNQGKNPFMEITVPDAVQALIQACGRLQRKESDEGDITLLDKRIVTKRYGQAILNALPNYRRVIA